MDAAATLERPRVFRITPANAREFQRRSAEAKHQNKLARALRSSPAVVKNACEERIAEIETERARLLRLMRNTDEANDIQKLCAARATLFDEWQVLTGTPNPGSRRGRQDRQARPVVTLRDPPTTPQEKPATT